MDDLGKLVSLLTAIVGLVSALVGYKVLIAKQKASHSSPTHIVRFKNPAVRTRPWNLKLLRWLNLFPASINLLVVLLLFAEFGYLAWFNIISAVISVLLIFIIRIQPPSRTRKVAEYVLELAPEEVVERSLKALRNMEANIGSYDAEQGLIEARTAMNWRTFGDVMLVRVSVENDNQTTLIVESDSPLPSTLYDFGSNARNIKRFEQELFRDNGQSSERPAA